MDVLFTSQKVLNLLPAALVLTGANRPDEAFDGPRDLPRPTRPLLRRRIATQKGGQSFDADGLQPEPNRLPMTVQLSRDRRHRESLGHQFRGDYNPSSCIPVQSLLWTVGFLRQQCDSCHYYNIVISLIGSGKEKKTYRKIVHSDLWSGWAIARSN